MSPGGSGTDEEHAYNQLVGARLRKIRTERRLSMAAIAELSEGEFGTAALGAYERGSRAISLLRLQRLAELYDVPIEELLPAGRPAALRATEVAERPESLRLNLSALRLSESREAEAVRNFIERVRSERHDYGGRVFTIRIEDVRVLGASVGLNETEMIDRLDDLRLLVGVRR